MEYPNTFRDQMDHEVVLKAKPTRIVSLVPSQTELLFDLGLDEQVVGITKFCIHPDAWFRNKTRVGGTKQYNFDKIESLQPDLIIGNKEENDEEQIRELQKKFPVWMSDIKNLDEAVDMIERIGKLTGTTDRALTISSQIKTGFAGLETGMKSTSSRKAAYLIWKNPYMVAGPSTFIDSILQRLNMHNVIRTGRYPETTLNELMELAPDVLFLSSEPYPFKEEHAVEIQRVLPETTVMLVDGEFFSWYGSRLLNAPSYFRKLMSQMQNLRE